MLKLYYKLETQLRDTFFHNNHYRSFDKFIKTHFKNRKSLVGVEIGVLDGCHADSLLFNVGNIRILYLVDPYENYKGYENNYREDVGGLNQRYKNAKKRLGVYGSRKIFIRQKFQDAIDSIPGNLDFVYYDVYGNNTDWVDEALNLYWGKIRVGGVFGGFNFDVSHICTVRQILGWVDKYDMNVFFDGQNRDWWIVKGGVFDVVKSKDKYKRVVKSF